MAAETPAGGTERTKPVATTVPQGGACGWRGAGGRDLVGGDQEGNELMRYRWRRGNQYRWTGSNSSMIPSYPHWVC